MDPVRNLRDILSRFESVLGNAEKSGSKGSRRQHTLRGDSIVLEQITEEGTPYIKIGFPKDQYVKIPDGTKGKKVRYESPTDGDKRIVRVSYSEGRYTIVPD